MKKSSLSDRLLYLIQLFRESINDSNGAVDIPNNKKVKFNQLWNSIIEDLMWEPGKLIYINDPEKISAYETVIDIMWHTLDTEEMFNDLTSGGYSGLLVDIVGNYIDRAKVIKPIFISIDPKKEDFNIYFNEAMKSYFYGLNKSALILICSILESTIKMELSKIDNKLVYHLSEKNGKTKVIVHSLKKLINNAAKKNLITFEEQETAHDIRELRNDAVHELLQVSSEQTYNAIINTKNLIESLFGKKTAVNN